MGSAARIGSAGGGCNARLLGAGGQNVGHANQRQVLTVALGALRRVLTTALHKVNDLVALDLGDHFGLNRSTGHKGHTNGDGVAADHQDIVELDLVTSIGGQLFNAQNVTRLHLVLLATGLEDREHGSFLFITRVLRPPCAGVVWGKPRLRTARPLGASLQI